MKKKSISIANPFARAKVGENGFLGDIARSGHGLQRSFVVALLQVLSTIQEQEKSTLILGFEEPELYQHPPQARHLASLLEQLSTQNNQVILTTHNPYFVSSKGYEQIRLVKKQDDQTGTKVSQFSFEELSKKLSDALNDQPKHPSELIASITQIMQPTQNEMFFCYIPIFVEGPEDVAIISTYLQFHSYWSDFRKLGCHFIICEGKTNISRPLAIAYGFNLPCFVIFDGDSDETQLDSIEKNKRDNRCLLYLLDDDSPPMPEENLFKYNFVMWNTKIINEIQKDIGVDTWNKAEEISRSEYNLFAGVRQKNPILVSSILEYLLSNHYSLPLLESLSENIFTYARENTSCSI